MSSEEIQEIPEIPQEFPEIPQEIPQEFPEIQENKNEECTDVAPLVPKRGRGRPKGAKNKVKILVVETDIPSVTLSEEPTEKEEAAPLKRPRVQKHVLGHATRTKRAQPPLDPLPERRECSGTTVSPIASMMMSLHEMQQERMAARKAMFRNMIA